MTYGFLPTGPYWSLQKYQKTSSSHLLFDGEEVIHSVQTPNIEHSARDRGLRGMDPFALKSCLYL